MPADVAACIETWRRLQAVGFTHLVYGRKTAQAFIAERLGARYSSAFEACYHPAMQSDYFRLCYLHVEGGYYVDADDVHTGVSIEELFLDSRMKLQPLCYDTSKNSMVPPSVFTQEDRSSSHWIFYFNNNPLIAGAGHPVIRRALEMATTNLEQSSDGTLPEIQSATGPGNLTKAIFVMASEGSDVRSSLLSMANWESVAISKWPLSYRNDPRNWRLSNQQRYENVHQASS
jgi:mannosyltransferase OCH1-like enzyme